ncbi:MAG TPA: hypothetical protein GX010_04785 [Erysipelotrichaceae bacterium]|nr:hypothetical protein [Erysipelotrichaceae bacterium]
MKERTKEILRDGFGCLINNAAAIRGAKNGPLWLTIVMFVLSVFLPVVPIFTAQANTNGSYFLNTYSYGLERYITSIGLDLKNNRQAEFNISEDHLLSVTENGVAVNFDEYGTLKEYASYVNTVTNQYDFLVYLAKAPTLSDKRLINSNISTVYYGLGSTDVSADTENIYRPSYMILYENGIYVAIYENNGTKGVVSSYVGDFKTTKASSTFLTDMMTVKDKESHNVAADILDDDYTAGVLKNFKRILDVSYETEKVHGMWISSGIYCAVFFGLGLVMGFLMWLLTRGKNNPNNYFSLWLCLKIAARLALAPALITLVVGFFLANQTPIIFIMTFGIRVMWISMKELRPIQN